VVLAAIIVIAGLATYAYAFSPQPIRHPTSTHFHFRLQILADGQPVNFAQDKFQTPFNTDICTAALTQQPVHFHDSVDQFVHIHWAGITGGILLKDYGWNLIGGPSGVLGYKFNGFKLPIAVPIHGHALPSAAAGDHYYVYTGVATNFHQRDWNDFLRQPLKDFFSGSAVLSSDSEKGPAQLNHVVGNAVIFVQKNSPTSDQVKARFEHLNALPTSSCSG
jgi:hypothetical protein